MHTTSQLIGQPLCNSFFNHCGNLIVNCCGNSLANCCDNSLFHRCGNSLVDRWGRSLIYHCGNMLVYSWESLQLWQLVGSSSWQLNRSLLEHILGYCCNNSLCHKLVKKVKREIIIALLVPKPKENIIFCRTDLDWSKVHGKHMEIDQIAKIPSTRIGDFIRGEEMNLDAPCSFTQVQNKHLGSRSTTSLLYEV